VISRVGGRLPLFFLAALFSAIAALFVVFAYNLYPLPSGDSHLFVPPAVSLRNGHGFRDPLSGLKDLLDPSGRARYVQYPPLFPLVIAACMPTGSVRAAYLVIAGMSVLALAAAAFLLWRDLEPEKPLSFRPALEIGFAGLGMATALLGQQAGRPEALATPIALAACAVMLHWRGVPARPWFVGLLIGLMGAVHPMGAVLLWLLLCAVLAVQLATLPAVRFATLSLATALGAFAAILALSPSGLPAIIAGSWRHAHIALLRGSPASIAWYWLNSSTASFYAFPYLATLGLIVALLVSRRLAPRSWSLLALAVSGGAAIVWLTVVQVPELCYNVILFAPIVFWFNLHAARRLGSSSARAAITACSGVSALGFVRSVILLAIFLRSGVPFAAARSAYARLAEHTTGPVAITPSFWVLAEDYDRMEVILDALHAGARPGAMMVQQSYSGLLEPPQVPQFMLLEDRFAHRPYQLLGITIAHSLPGYGFAIYRRTGLEPDASAGPLGAAGTALAPAARRARGTVKQ
jgi:hypothetical protein